jgi:uncharacterized protein YjdB
MWFSALLLTVLTIGCGGGDQGRGPILGVDGPALVGLAVTPATASVASGGMQQFVATATFANGASRDVTLASAWTSDAAATAIVNSTSGIATGVASGTVAINASFGGKSAAASLTVTPATLVTIAVTPANPSIGIGAKQQFVAQGTFSDGTTRDISAISTFTSATPAIATSLTTGLATGIATGSSVITATSGVRTGSTTLTVTPATLVSLAITPANPTLQIGATQQLTVKGTFSDGAITDVTNSVAYVSATPAMVTVGAATGLTTGVAAGASVITASLSGKTATTTVTVTAVVLSSISVTPAVASIVVGGTQSFVATATFSDGSSANISNTVLWTSGNTLVATILQTGTASALAAGTSTITATSGLKSATAALTVTSAVSLSSIAISPLNPSVQVGGFQQFTATGTYSDASTQDITNAVVWASSSTATATILQTGRASALAVGVSNISATQGARTVATNLTVTAVPILGINLGGAANFGVLAGASITNNSGGTTVVTGDVGSPSQTVDPVQAAGFTNYKSGAVLTTALGDLQTAITDANSRGCDVSSAAGIDLGGQTFTPGVYCYAGAITITGTFAMNGPGVYIFRTSATLDTTANSIVALNGGATADNVFWVPVGATTLGANSFFKGTIMGQSAAITLGDNASLQNGRVLTGSAATLRNNVISR